MKNIVRALIVCCLMLFTAGPALAKLSVTFVNRTDFEIQSISIKGDSGGMGFTIRVVPGNFCVFTDANGTELHEVVIDAGLMLFTFTDMAALAGNDNPTLELTYDADGRPHLTLVDKPGQTDSGQANSGSVPDGGSFDLPAGPLWDNNHAQQRCPEVLAEWLAANPGKQAEWTGNWVTVEPGEMSVCGMALTGTGEEPSSPASPSLINVVGTVTAFADPSTPAETDFTAILNAENLGEIRAMGARDASLSSSQVYLPATFAGKTWAVFVVSAEAFSRDDADKPGMCILRTYTGGPEGLRSLMQNLAAEGFRPWFAQLTAGEDMDTEEMVKFWEEDMNAEEAWEQVADASKDINEGGKPAAVDMLLLPEDAYTRAAKGDTDPMPGFRLRVSNAAVITLRYLPDASDLVSLTRE